MLKEDVVRRVKYICSKCESKDTLKLWPNNPVPVAVNCWKCGAGRGVELSHMLQNGIGMFAQPEIEIVA